MDDGRTGEFRRESRLGKRTGQEMQQTRLEWSRVVSSRPLTR